MWQCVVQARWVLLLSALVLHAAVRTDMDHLHCFLFLSPLLSFILLLVLLHHFLLTVSWRRAENNQKHSVTAHSAPDLTVFICTKSTTLCAKTGLKLHWDYLFLNKLISVIRRKSIWQSKQDLSLQHSASNMVLASPSFFHWFRKIRNTLKYLQFSLSNMTKP